MRVNAKEREVKRAKKREGIEVERVKPSAPTQVIGALKEEEEQNENRKKNKKKETKNRAPTQLPWTIQLPPTTRRDQPVNLFL